MASSDNAGTRHQEPHAVAERGSAPATDDAPADADNAEAADADNAEAADGADEAADGSAAAPDPRPANGPAGDAAPADTPPSSPLSKVRAAWRARTRSSDNGETDDSGGSAENDAAPAGDSGSGSGDDTSGELIVEQVDGPLISGDPLLTGPTPVVRKSKRTPKPPPSGAGDDRSRDEETESGRTAATDGESSTTTGDVSSTGETETADEPGTIERAEADTATSSDVSAGEQEQTRPDPRDLLTPGTGDRAAAVPGVPGGDSGPIPAPSATTPPPAPMLRDPSSPTVMPGGRQATRGRQATGPIPAVTQRAAPAADPSGPVTRPTAVAPVPRIVGRRPRVRRVTRVVRHVDPWSVFKIAAAFSFVAYGIALLAGVLLWNVAYATGTIDNIERGLESTGWETFELDGAAIFHNAWIGGIFAAVGLTGFAVLAATLFNLVTDLVGGMRMTVLEEEVIEKPASPTRRYAGQRQQQPAPPPPRRPVPPPPRR